jgi:DNA-3-methyladenine glycosylase II
MLSPYNICDILRNGRMRLINESNLPKIARELAEQNEHLRIVINRYGPPPLWAREPGFATLLQIILEQQVSLASAKACFDKLERRIGAVTPENLLNSSDQHLRADGFSRQKTAYARHLAEALVNKHVDLDVLHSRSDGEVRSELMQLKGVGPWTSDIYLLMALRRADVMPKGDIALHTAWHKLSGEPRPDADRFLEIAERWRPYRSVAARMLWHFYLSERNAQHL